MGFPLGIRDQDILTPPPSIPESQSQAEAAIVHVKLSKAFGHIVDSKLINISDGWKLFLIQIQRSTMAVAR